MEPPTAPSEAHRSADDKLLKPLREPAPQQQLMYMSSIWERMTHVCISCFTSSRFLGSVAHAPLLGDRGKHSADTDSCLDPHFHCAHGALLCQRSLRSVVIGKQPS
eukprot:4093677-Amphidinium_carterae.1